VTASAISAVTRPNPTPRPRRPVDQMRVAGHDVEVLAVDGHA
jgi:hypothetical protein